MKRGSRLRLRHLIIIGLAVLLVAGAGFSAQRLWLNGDAPATNPLATQATVAEPVEPVGLETRIFFGGDMYWGRSVNRWAQASPLKEAYPFSGLSGFGREKYDAWIANMECPSVPGVEQPFSLEAEKLAFNCPSTYLPEMAKWFTAVSLANNHTTNQGGQPGIEATRKALEAQGVQYFGHYDPRVLADVCEVVSLPARLQLNNGKTQKITMPMGLCGYHGLATVPSAEALAVMQEYAKYMPVVAYPHMGTEYTTIIDSQRKRLYEAMIDNGADAVLAGHPHWVQTAEAYKGKLIVFSMGNFMFDQQLGETQQGAAIDLTLKVVAGSVATANLEAWQKLDGLCKNFRDDCLAQAKALNLKRLPFTFSYQAQGVDLSNKLTKPADAALNQKTLERLNWAAVLTELE